MDIHKKYSMCDITEEYDEHILFDINFKKAVTGYHYINSNPINETTWEDLNSLIFSKSNGFSAFT